ncbi:MAG: T9SS type A sorting domain-containing protein, partial [bacterium]|nr:T9SS type A sorting domain-containing protein [bacterium]
RRNIFFSGMLIYLKGNNYTIASDYLLNAIKANRDRNVHGEAFFFYEGLKRNRLGDTLRATYYAKPALLPHRNGNIWRPKALIVNEDDSDAVIFGAWEKSPISGFKPNILIKKDASYAAITYFFDVPFSAWYDVFIYNVIGPLATTKAPVTIYQDNDSTTIAVSQQNFYNAGWQPLTSVFLTAGRHKVLKIDNTNVPAGQYVVADAAMIMINRKLSPDVVVTSIETKSQASALQPAGFCLFQNYPNPFNHATNIRYSLSQSNWVSLKIYDMLGRMVAEPVNQFCEAGNFEIVFDAKACPSGVYFCILQVGQACESRKLLLLK